MPDSNPPDRSAEAVALRLSNVDAAEPFSKNGIKRSISLCVSGRRYASAPMRAMICRAHGRSSADTVGRQLKILWRLAVSEMPVGWNGPLTMKSFTCGSVVIPGPPDPPPA